MKKQLLQGLYRRLREMELSERLHQMGWRDFFEYDCPDTDDPITLATEALIHLTVIDEQWNPEYGVLFGVLGFLSDACGRPPVSWEREEIEKLLGKNPVDLAQIRMWFRDTFGQTTG